jgi:hypothetical protein
MRKTLLIALTCLFVPASVAPASTSHEGWPRINGMLLMNKTDAARPLDARPGHDPFGGTDPRYSCDAVHKRGACHRRMVRSGSGRVRDLEVGPQRAARRARQRHDAYSAVADGTSVTGRPGSYADVSGWSPPPPPRPGITRHNAGLGISRLMRMSA